MSHALERLLPVLLVVPLLAACNTDEFGGEPWDLSAESENVSPVDVAPRGDVHPVDTGPLVRSDTEEGEDVSFDENKVDLLWVIDNSSSMCEEQTALGRSFGEFLETLRETPIDFHFAVTTTSYQAPYSVVAQGGHLQSTPHPMVGFAETCRVDRDAPDPYGKLRRQIEKAVACTKNPDKYEQLRSLSDDQIICALEKDNAPEACQRAGWDPDEAGLYRLFPCGVEYGERCETTEQLEKIYRDIPKVLDTEEYRQADGSLNVDRLQSDFACMSFVGTRGSAFEQGLRAAVEAISPEMTGGPVEEPEDTSAPNHGFIRRSARTAVLFVSDENDCSTPDGVDLAEKYGCGEMGCYYPTRHGTENQQPLMSTSRLAHDFVTNLVASKDVDSLDTDHIVMGSLHGSYHRYTGEVVQNCGGRARKLRTQARVCSTDLGSATSGDRYEDFLHNFPVTFPESNGGHLTGWMCRGNLEQALNQFAEKLKDFP